MNGSGSASSGHGRSAYSGYVSSSPYHDDDSIDIHRIGYLESDNISYQPQESAPLKVWTDGAAKNNGRAGTKAGWGVYYGNGHPDNDYGPVSEGAPTNQRAELEAIWHAASNHYNKNPDKKLIVHTDSQYSIDCITKWSHKWERNGYYNVKGELVANSDLIQRIKRYYDMGNMEFVHVRGHTGVEGNEAADRLANLGAQYYR